jgi:hypothetical protein
MPHVIKWLALKCHMSLRNNLVAHVFAYATYCKIANRYKRAWYHIYICIHGCHMQLVVCYNLFYATMQKPIACDLCNYKSIAYASCEMGNLL